VLSLKILFKRKNELIFLNLKLKFSIPSSYDGGFCRLLLFIDIPADVVAIPEFLLLRFNLDDCCSWCCCLLDEDDEVR
jgi:hypothetical protein